MAEKMMPYALRMTLAVLANKPDDARSISAECVTAMTKELMGVVSRYDLMDFPFMVAPCGSPQPRWSPCWMSMERGLPITSSPTPPASPLMLPS